MRNSIVAFVAALSLAAAPAYADRGYYQGGHNQGSHYRGGHDGYRHHHGGGSAWAGLAVVGALAGLAILADQSRPRYATTYEVQPVYPAPPVYSAPSASGTWYYCQSSGMYYPYTNACPEGWQAMPARPY